MKLNIEGQLLKFIDHKSG